MTTTSQGRNATFRSVPYMGVIYVVAEAMKLGFRNGDPDWCNLGQGQPEVGPMDGAPERWSTIELEPQDHAYGHIGGTDEMRQTIADHYNRLFRTGEKKQYGKEHISVASGGRLMLARMFATLDAVNVGYQVPDYTAYEDMLDYHRYRISPVLVPTTPAKGFVTSSADLAGVVQRERLGAYVISNPCNPTGQLVQGDELAGYVRVARDASCTMIFDEFYSHFIYAHDGKPGSGPVSAAEFVEDVDHDPVLVIDGLTKNFRYPGWRLGWAVGPPGRHRGDQPCCQRHRWRAQHRGAAGRVARARAGARGSGDHRATPGVCPQTQPDGATAGRHRCQVRPPTGRDVLRVGGYRRPARAAERCGCVLPGRAPAQGHDGPGPVLQRESRATPGRRPDYRNWVRFSFGPPEDNVGLGLDRLEAMIGEC